MIMKKLLLIILCVFMQFPLQAQNDRKTSRLETLQNAVTIEPLYWFNNGLKINYERELFPKNWIEAGVVGYLYHRENFQGVFGATYFGDNDAEKASGYGFDLHYKWLPVPFMYVSCGFQYRRHKVHYEDYVLGFQDFEEDGLTFYEPALMDANQIISRYGGTLRIGFQTRTFRRVSAGGFIGLSYFNSDYDKVYYRNGSWDGPLNSLYHKGLVLDMGFKIGLRF